MVTDGCKTNANKGLSSTVSLCFELNANVVMLTCEPSKLPTTLFINRWNVFGTERGDSVRIQPSWSDESYSFDSD